jgi:hypothetical protein
MLINPTDDTMEGTVRFFARDGQRDPLGTRSDVLSYRVAPRSSRRITNEGTGAIREGYAVIEPQSGGTPHTFVTLRQRLGDRVTSETLVTGVQGASAGFAVDLRPTLIRHGEIDTKLIVVNSGTEAANITVRLDDRVVDRSIAPGETAELSAAQEFGAEVSGVVELESDVEITVTARQSVTNISGDLIESELPPLVAAPYFPYVHNGQGISTEFRLANPSARRMEGQLEFARPGGEPADATILR